MVILVSGVQHNDSIFAYIIKWLSQDYKNFFLWWELSGFILLIIFKCATKCIINYSHHAVHGLFTLYWKLSFLTSFTHSAPYTSGSYQFVLSGYELGFLCCCSIFRPYCTAGGILVSWSGTELMHLAVGAES